MARKLSPRKQPSQERARATVDALLTAAAQVLEAEGEEGFTTNKIAERAGVSIGTLYQYFPNKESLVQGLIQAHHDRIRQAVRGALDSQAARPLQVAVRSALAALMGVYAPNLRLTTHVERVAVSTGDRSEIEIVLEELERWIRSFLEDRRAETRLPDPGLMAFVLVRALEGVILGASLRRPELLTTEAFLDQLERLVLGYVSSGLGPAQLPGLSLPPANDPPTGPPTGD